MLLLAALIAVQPAPPVRQQAQATVKIVRAVRVSNYEWDRVPTSRRREIIVTEENRPRTVRIIEFE